MSDHHPLTDPDFESPYRIPSAESSVPFPQGTAGDRIDTYIKERADDALEAQGERLREAEKLLARWFDPTPKPDPDSLLIDTQRFLASREMP